MSYELTYSTILLMFKIKRVQTDENSLVIIAKKGQEDVGNASAHIEGNTVELECITTDPVVARNGLGTIMLGHITRWGKKKGAEELTGDYRPEGFRGNAAEKFYDKNGVEIVDGRLRKRL